MNAVADRFAADFHTRAATLPGSRLPWLATLRQRAFERFAEEGLPTASMENWKYTDLARMLGGGFSPATGGVFPDLAGIDHIGKGMRLVFVDGRQAPSLALPDHLPEGATVLSLADALVSHPELIEAHYGRPEEGTPLAALNAALAVDGVVIHLRRGTVVEAPIHLIFAATEAGAANYPRVLIVAEENTQAVVVEHYLGRCEGAYFTDAVTRIDAGRDARICHYKLQDECPEAFHVADIGAAQAAGSHLESHSLSLGARLARNDIATRFDGEHCEALLNGLFVAVGRQHVDHQTRIDHAQAHGSSREHYRGIVADAAKGVFTGRILVREGAQKTDAFQRSDALLLSAQAEADARPQLEIYADDVKCSHGATVGQLDDDAVFYLRTRGISEPLARDLLTYAFAREVLDRVRLDPLRLHVESALLSRLPAGQRLREMQTAPLS